jgi:membrane fusion protein, heavy metal efflux system
MRASAIISSLFLFFAVGCKKGGSDAGAGHGHDHGSAGHSHAATEEEKTAQITVWSAQYEIFAEHKTSIAGKPTKFITHVSDIKTGEPRRAGLIRFVLNQAGNKFEHPQAAPERAGIYIPAITFPKEGAWKATVVIPGDNEAIVDLGTIKVYPNADAAAKAEIPEPPEGISFLKEQQWRILARSEPAKKRTLVQRVALHATVVPAPGSKAMVHSTITGTLLDGNAAQIGSPVKAGDLLAWVQPAFGEFTTKLVDAEAEAIRTKATLEQAQSVFNRTKGLFEQQAKSEREFKEAEVAFRTAQASYDAAASVQKLYKATGASFEGGTVKIGITTPIDGIVDRVLANPGARVTPEEPVFAVINPASFYVQAQVPEARLGDLDPQLGTVFVPAGKGTNVVQLKFLALGQEIDAPTRTAPLTFAFENQNQRVPLGSTGTLLVGSRRAIEGIAVPSDSIVEEDGIPIVFVQVSGETYQKRDVALGVRDGNWIEIKSGVAEGERVATDGAYAILLSTKSGTIPAHGHAH